MRNIPYHPYPVDIDALGGGGSMGALMRSHDWSRTSLGPCSSWPQSLRTVVNILLTSRYAMWMGWGESLSFLYNDAYQPTLGFKHPWALGTPAKDVWAEIWSDIGPRITAVLSTGEATYDQGLLIFLERSGFPEETYHTFSYSPLADDSGAIAGMLCVVTEETERIISERRMATLRDLAAGLATSNTESEVLAAVERQLATNRKDLPFTLIYLYDPEGAAELVCATGIPKGHPAAPNRIDAETGTAPWPAREMLWHPGQRTVDALGTRWDSGSLPSGDWDRPSEQAVLVPIKQQGQERAAGFLVVGVNPYRHYDAAYKGFVELVAGQVAAGLANARAYEEERRRAEALAELDRAKTAFFSNVSHEFRTPLTLLLGPVEDILAKPAEQVRPEHRELLELAHRNGLRLQHLVNTLLDFSRIEAGRAQANFQPTDLTLFTAELAFTFRSLMDRAGLAFHVDCAPLSRPVSIDREMWEKVVLNLISNAFKYTLEGSVRVWLVERDGRAEFSVSDSGVGIPEKDLPHLFERFYCVEGSRARTHQGTGIGLALVRELVKLLGGAVTVWSRFGEGSTFTVSLPLDGADRRTGQPAMAATPIWSAGSYVKEALNWLPDAGGRNVPAEAHAPGRSRVLLADDNTDMRDYLQRLLAAEYEVTAVANGEEAIAAALANPPDLVLSDVMMPVLDGFGLLRALRAHPSTQMAPVILLSARAGEEASVEGLQAGADDYLIKPFTKRELLSRVEAHLATARIRKQAAEREAELRAEAESARDEAVDVLESIADGFFALDNDWHFIYVNGAAERMLGVKRDEILGRIIWEAFAPAVGTIFDVESHRAMRERVTVEFEVQYEPWQRWFAVKAYPTQQGGISVYFRDVTERKRAETALRESEERFRVMADSAPVLIWMADASKRFNWFNRPWLEFAGRTMDAESVVGWIERVHPEDAERCVTTYNLAFGRREPFQMDYRLRRHDGEYRWMLNHGVPRYGLDGEFAGYIGSCFDITERRAAEEALRASEARFRFLSELDDVTRPLTNPHEITRAVARLLAEHLDVNRCAYAEVEDDEDTFLVLGDHNRGVKTTAGRYRLSQFGAECRRALREGRSYVVSDSENDARVAGLLEAYRQKGARAVVSVPLMKAERLVGVMAVHSVSPRHWRQEDVEFVQQVADRCWESMERARTGRELGEREQRFRFLAESIPQMVWTATPEGMLDYVNGQGTSYFGVLEGSLLGSGWLEFVHPEDQEQTVERWKQALASGEPYETAFRLRRGSDARWRWHLVRALPLVTEGRIAQWFGTCTDIEDQKAAEAELKRANRELEEFAYVSSHDLQEPLRMVNSYSQLLLRKLGPQANAELQGYADFIRTGVKRMEALIQDLLAYSRATHSEDSAPAGRADLDEALRRALTLVDSRVQENRAEITHDPLPVTKGDQLQLAHVFQNLLSNALKYRKLEETPRIHIGVSRKGSCWEVSVSDNGIGFDQQYSERIFGLFKRLHRDAEYPGTGLGLAICKRIVERYGGRMWAESREGVGSTFFMALPAEDQQLDRL